MADIKVQHIFTLAHLLSCGARHNFVSVTTTELGRAIDKSQQAASKHLTELEKGGFIERISGGRNHSIRITNKGYTELIKLKKVLNSSMDSRHSQIILKGNLVSGMGEGAYYMSLKGYTRQFKAKIGHVPFPGTLNIKLDKKEYIEAVRQLDMMEGLRIDGFSDERRTYGWVKCFSARIDAVDSQLIRLERTHHDPSIIELISKYNIRKAAGLSDGSKVAVRILL